MGTRITLEMNVQQALMAMCGTNPGALSVIMDLFQKVGNDAIWLLFHMDYAGIYGPDIWIAYKDVCKQDLDSLIKLIPDHNSLKAEVAKVKKPYR